MGAATFVARRVVSAFLSKHGFSVLFDDSHPLADGKIAAEKEAELRNFLRLLFGDERASGVVFPSAVYPSTYRVSIRRLHSLIQGKL